MGVLKKCWSVLKMVYLYVAYWFVGIPEEVFHRYKGNYWVELNSYHRAIRSYKKALKDSNDARLHAMIGYCYSRMGNNNEAVEFYRAAKNKIHDQRVDVGLARSEYEARNIDKSDEVIQQVRTQEIDLSTERTLDHLEEQIAVVRRERKKLEKRNQ
jgi:tetratricopeptide (TPR) repeat protein